MVKLDITHIKKDGKYTWIVNTALAYTFWNKSLQRVVNKDEPKELIDKGL